MNLLRTSLLSFVAMGTKVGAGLVINKAVAVFVGPSGVAMIGQFQNAIQMAMVVSQGGINTGVTKYTAEYARDDALLDALWGTATRISLICTLLVAAILLLFARPLSAYFLTTPDYTYVFTLLGVTIGLFVLNQLLLAMVNGLKEVGTYIHVNIVQSLYGLLFTTLLVVLFGLSGALIALATNQSVVLLFTLWKLRDHALIRLHRLCGGFSRSQARKLLGYSAMAFTSAALVPAIQIIVRNHIGHHLGWPAAGYWQGVWYISTTYLGVIGTALGIYYLPRLSEITARQELRRELLDGFRVIIPLVVIMSGTIFVLRDFIIHVLFTSDFTAMRELFLWQLVGDVLKAAAWLFAYVLLAKAMLRAFIVTEVLAGILFLVLVFPLVRLFGLIGVTYAFALTYSVYFVMVGAIVVPLMSVRHGS